MNYTGGETIENFEYWNKVKDEMCSCGHPKSKHGDTLAIGHGACKVEGCDCKKFTWDYFLDKDGKKI